MVARGIVAGLLAVGTLALSPPAGAQSAAPAGSAPGVVEAQGELHGVKVTVRASSMLADPKQPNHYSPINLLDADDSTVWAEGVPGNGEGQWVEFEAPSSASLIKGFEFTPGHAKSAALYAANTRPRLVQFTYFYKGESVGEFKVEIPQSAPPCSWIVNWDLLDGIKTFPDRIRATIKSVWPGTHAKDLCVSRFRPVFAGSTDAPSTKEAADQEDPGPAIVAMMGNLPKPETYLATDGIVNLNEFSSWSADGAPTGAAEHVTKRKGAHGDLYAWSCTGLVETMSWDKSGHDHHGFVRVVADPSSGGLITSYLEPPGVAHAKVRWFRAHWEKTARGWKVRSMDVQPLTDDDEKECE